MQDRYVGDVGDFGKYALLRAVCGYPSEREPLRLGIIWCLVGDESHNNDGRHTSYLNSGSRFEHLDPTLFARLKEMVSQERRNVHEVAAAGLFPNSAMFFDEYASNASLPANQRESHRAAWLRSCLVATRHCEMVFLDPDNGMETPSVGKRSPKAGKYIYWEELDPFVRREQSMIIYHHLNRTERSETQVDKLGARFRERLPRHYSLLGLTFRRGSRRTFWLCLTPRLAETAMGRVTRFLNAGWNAHFEVAYRE